MPSQFFGLNIAYSGLTSYQAALNTTGNNIANVETKGYSRQEAVRRAGDALRINASYGMAGSGVVTTSIGQIRNEYYDLKYWSNNTRLGQYAVKNNYTAQIQDLFMETKTVDGFDAIFSEKYFKAMEEVRKNPGDYPTKQQFISTAAGLAEYFNTMSTNLVRMQEDCNAEILNKVEEINTIAAKISIVNQQINVIEMTGVKANELRDERALLLDELSMICEIETIETPIVNSNNPDDPTGAYQFTVKIGGQVLVHGNDYNTLSCEARDKKVNQSDADGLYDVKWSNGLTLNLYGGGLGGELSGLIQMRDGNNAESFRGTASAINTTAPNYTVTIDTTESYLQDINKCTLPPSGKINVGDVIYEYTGWTFDSATGKYTFELTTPPRADTVGKTSKVGEAVDYQGIPYYMEQMNEWIRIYSKGVNDILKADGNSATGADGEALFVAKNLDGTEIDFADGNNTVISSTDESYYRVTATNFAVNNKLIENANLLVTTAQPKPGESAYDTIEKLKNLFTDTDAISFRGASSQDFLKCLLSDMALNASSAQTFTKNFTNIGKTIENQRLSVSGVDNDEEGVNMVKFQNAFNLNSKMVQVLTEIYDRLILQTGV